MKREIMKVTTCGMLSVCLIVTTGFSNITVDTQSETQGFVTLLDDTRGSSETIEVLPEKITKTTKEITENTKAEAEETVRKAAEEARRKAEEARRRAEEEARRKAEEARKKAEEEARKKAAKEAAKRKAAKEAAAKKKAGRHKKVSADDRTLLAAIIFCEAGGEPYEGKVAVGAVIMNRVRSGKFPNSIPGVIYQRGQFGPVVTGKLGRVLAAGKTTPACYEAADAALAGENPIGSRLYFGNGHSGYRIGGHYFH